MSVIVLSTFRILSSHVHSLICQLLELYDQAIILNPMIQKCDFLYKVKILYKYQ